MIITINSGTYLNLPSIELEMVWGFTAFSFSRLKMIVICLSYAYNPSFGDWSGALKV